MPAPGPKGSPRPVIRLAQLGDVEKMQALINHFATGNTMLSRSLLELYSNIRDYVVVARGDEILGTCALHIYWSDLAEIKALTVSEALQGKGWGRRLTEFCLKEARRLGIRRVFALTYQDQFFTKLGFALINRDQLPQKVWMECINCIKFPNCDEKAMMFEFPE